MVEVYSTHIGNHYYSWYNPRMRLDKLVLHGFKSFADKTTFDFTKNFTAIVGPNGSGKSNISDAIRWVLGEQSLKLLRGKQSADLIFSGSDQLAKLGMALVELHLDNSSGVFPVDYQEIVISRKLFRNGDAEYRLNNAQVRLQDIIMMLAKAKFGQKSYAVIGQGMITHFLNSTPQERKAFFDEATGVKEFQIKRDQAINKLIRTEENLVQSEALLDEIEPHLRSLTRQVNRLKRREKIEEELRGIQLDYYGSMWSELKKEHFTLKQQAENETTEIKDLEEELQKEQSANNELAQAASRGERYQLLQQKFNDVLEQKSHALKEQAVLKGKLEVEHERQGELSLVWMQRKEDELLKDVHELESELTLLKQQIQREVAELKRAEQNLQSLHDEFRSEEYSILKLKEQIERESHSLSVPEIQARFRELFDAQEQFLRQLIQTKSLDEFRDVQTQAKKITKQFADLMDELSSDEKNTVEALRVDMKRKEQSLERLAQNREEQQHQLNELRVSTESAKNKVKFNETHLKRQQDGLATMQSNIDEVEKEKGESAEGSQAELYTQQLEEYEKQIEHFDKQLKATREEIDVFNREEENKKTQLVAIQTQMSMLQRQLTNIRQNANTIEVNLARVETRQEDLTEEISREVNASLHSDIYQYEHVKKVNRAALEKKMITLQKQVSAIGDVDDETLKEYEETKERHDFLKEQIMDLDESIQSLEKVIDELDNTIHKQFQKNFKVINDGFQKYFKVLFDGGTSKLALLTETEQPEEAAEESTGVHGASEDALLDENEVAEGVSGESLHDEKERELIGKKKKKQKIIAGIDVMASPPGKKVKNINALSGGEKSLVAIALLCAIIAHNPSPFVVLDEVEAALDEENSEKLAAILIDLAKKTQIIIITHNRVTMRAADVLYGVTVGKEGKSHILSVELSEAEELVEG